MPYAIRYRGKYLHRSANAGYSRRKRTLTDDVERATTWAQPSHAKNAAREAWESGLVPKTHSLEVVFLRLIPTENAHRIARKADRYGKVRTMDVP